MPCLCAVEYGIHTVYMRTRTARTCNFIGIDFPYLEMALMRKSGAVRLTPTLASIVCIWWSTMFCLLHDYGDGKQTHRHTYTHEGRWDSGANTVTQNTRVDHNKQMCTYGIYIEHSTHMTHWIVLSVVECVFVCVHVRVHAI